MFSMNLEMHRKEAGSASAKEELNAAEGCTVASKPVGAKSRREAHRYSR